MILKELAVSVAISTTPTVPETTEFTQISVPSGVKAAFVASTGIGTDPVTAFVVRSMISMVDAPQSVLTTPAIPPFGDVTTSLVADDAVPIGIVPVDVFVATSNISTWSPSRSAT